MLVWLLYGYNSQTGQQWNEMTIGAEECFYSWKSCEGLSRPKFEPLAYAMSFAFGAGADANFAYNAWTRDTAGKWTRSYFQLINWWKVPAAYLP